MLTPTAGFYLPLSLRHSAPGTKSGAGSSQSAQPATPLKLVPGNHAALTEFQRRVKETAGAWPGRLRSELVAQAKNAGIQTASRLLAGAVAYYGLQMMLPQRQRSDFMQRLHSTVTGSAVPGVELVGTTLHDLLRDHPVIALSFSDFTSWMRVIRGMQGAFSKILETAVSKGDTKLAIHQRWKAQLDQLNSAIENDSVRKLLPEEMYTELSRVMTTLRASVFNTDSPVHINYNIVQNDWDKAITLLSLPLETVNVFQHGTGGNPTEARMIDQKVNKVLARYDPDKVAQPLREFMFSVREWFNKRNDAPVPVAFLTSPPATGKTTVVRQLCEAIGATLVVVTMEDVVAFLDQSKARGFIPPDEARSEVYGNLVAKIIETCDTRNYVIFIDEANLQTNKKHVEASEQLKRWLDPENPYHPKIPGFMFKPDLRAPVIIASNYGIEDEALKTRMAAYIEFPSWTPEQFEELAREYFQAESVRRRDEQDFHVDVIDAVLERLEDVVNFIVEDHRNYDPTAVTIREVKIAIGDMMRDSLILAAAGNEINPDNFKRRIKARFEAIAKTRPAEAAGGGKVLETVTAVTTTRSEQTFTTLVGPRVPSSSAVQSPPVAAVALASVPARESSKTAPVQLPPIPPTQPRKRPSYKSLLTAMNPRGDTGKGKGKAAPSE